MYKKTMFSNDICKKYSHFHGLLVQYMGHSPKIEKFLVSNVELYGRDEFDIYLLNLQIDSSNSEVLL